MTTFWEEVVSTGGNWMTGEPTRNYSPPLDSGFCYCYFEPALYTPGKEREIYEKSYKHGRRTRMVMRAEGSHVINVDFC